jgi:two-component system chemotaxis sensor kinase CheA
MLGSMRQVGQTRETAKPIELVWEVKETEIDKAVVDELEDPLVHLIRNAAEHGLEPIRFS